MLLILLPPDVILTIGACSLQQPPLPHPLLKNERMVEGWLRTERGKMKTSVPPWPYLGVWQSHETQKEEKNIKKVEDLHLRTVQLSESIKEQWSESCSRMKSHLLTRLHFSLLPPLLLR